MTTQLISSGLLDFVYKDVAYQTWYKVVGELGAGKTPLVIVNGGPGIPHNYMTPHALLHEKHGIPVVLYDQLGCGKSTHCKDKPADFWSIQLYNSELDNLLARLGIADCFDLLGHSWGGMLAQEFVVTLQPRGLRRLVLTDTLPTMDLYVQCVNTLLGRMPKEIQDIVKEHEAAGTTDSKEYHDACDVFYKKHLCKLDPWPKDLADAFTMLAEDPTVYMTMQGPSEFTITGTLKGWTVIDRIPSISTQTLLINGVDDTCRDECMGPIFQRVQKAKWVQFAKSGHMPFWDEQERYVQIVGDWLCDA